MTEHHHHPVNLTTRAALASVATAMLLLVLKAYAAVRTDSVAMLGSLADSGLDLVASLVTLYGVRLAAEPADREHRFGHGKAEALTALFQVALILVSAVAIAWRATHRLVAGLTSTDAEEGIVVSAVAIAATLALVLYQRSVIRRTASVAIQADNIHYQSDLLVNVSVIVALALEQFAHIVGADAVFGVLIALALGYGAWRSSIHAINQLMDREWPDERRLAFLEVTKRHPKNRGTHDLRTRSSGAQDFAQFHIWVDPGMTVAQAHEVMDEIEADLAREFPGVEVLIHLDPEGHTDLPVGSPLRAHAETVE